MKVNKLVQDQVALAQDSHALQKELESAWSAAATNAGVAREVFRRAQASSQDEELSRLRARVSEFEAQQSLKELISEQHQELIKEIRAQAAATQGIRSTTDGIAQALENSLTVSQSPASKRRSHTIEPVTAEREPGAERRGSIQSLKSSSQQLSPRSQPPPRDQLFETQTPTRPSSRRSRIRVPRGSTTPASESVQGTPGVSLSGGFTFRPAPEPTPEPALGLPPPSASEPPISVGDHEKPEQVLSNILVWDGSELFNQAELPAQIMDQLRGLLEDNICTLDTKKFDTFFAAGVNSVPSLCIWKRAGLKSKVPFKPIGYHACHECIAANRPCLLRIKDITRGQRTRPHLAPLPNDIRPLNATRRDPEYWVVPNAQF